ncbi:hypothetical protein [Xanthomonas arboricola]|uniref:Endonuclease V-like protein UPF0215 family n=1 Tax=Xanthomonas arboricola TaxID=56448 RepID=A0AB73H311_9XANT|nr:hypothetical protein [Xanthomonas arboricola]MBB5672296.1 endonuclease V-like protein UPF0215 family [Xanthomonas arboricola]
MSLSIGSAFDAAQAKRWALRGWSRSTRALQASTPRQRLYAAGAIGLLAVCLAWWSLVDHTRVLTEEEVASVMNWVSATQSTDVQLAFEARFGDRELTLAELGEIAEVAKGAALPQGIYQPVVLDR